MGDIPFRDLVELCEALERTTKRSSMIALIASFFKKIPSDLVGIAARMIVGKIFPEWSHKTLDISWRTIIKVIKEITGTKPKDILDAFNKTGDPGDMTKILFEKKKGVKQITLLAPQKQQITLLDVYKIFNEVSEVKGEGSKRKKELLLRGLLEKCEPLEAKYIVKILLGEMRHGASEGIVEEALALLSNAPIELVKRAHMLTGDIGEVAEIAVKGGIRALKEVKMRLFHPIEPMLAQAAESVEEALKIHGGRTAFEWKLDGARVQIHKKENEVKIFSRRLTDVTLSLPDVVAQVRDNIKAREVILEGEVIAIGNDGKPLPFQHLMRRFRRVKDVKEMVEEIPVRLYLFDILYLNGNLLIDMPYVERREKLYEISGDIQLVPQIITSDSKEAEHFFKAARSAGHEGLMAKKPNSDYTPGIRGKKWLKIKETLDTLDLVIVAADWGYGRRYKWLSDYYLAARDENSGEFLVVGKTFKGLTDEEFEHMTKRLLELKIGERGRTVFVKPEVVVEVAFDEIQKSPKYKSGYALRFARIVRIREDKRPEEADTITRIRELFEKQFRSKARAE
ncbi:MAG: ATP-dependent DNA ligase [Candidatus Baldrarchaeia archaeon]